MCVRYICVRVCVCVALFHLLNRFRVSRSAALCLTFTVCTPLTHTNSHYFSPCLCQASVIGPAVKSSVASQRHAGYIVLQVMSSLRVCLVCLCSCGTFVPAVMYVYIDERLFVVLYKWAYFRSFFHPVTSTCSPASHLVYLFLPSRLSS